MKHIKIDTQGINIFFSHINLDTPLKVKNFQKRETPSNFCFSKNSYEYSNHLGNVLEVVSDRKLQVQLPDSEIGDEPLGGGVVDYYVADVVSQSDYYPFGMLLPNRNEEDGADYRYSFQGQEKDDEIKGGNNSVNYKYRMHDPRIGRFFAVDPLTKKYPHYTPYSFSGNKVIHAIELEGLEDVVLSGTVVNEYGPTLGFEGEAEAYYDFKNTSRIDLSAPNNLQLKALIESALPVQLKEGWTIFLQLDQVTDQLDHEALVYSWVGGLTDVEMVDYVKLNIRFGYVHVFDENNNTVYYTSVLYDKSTKHIGIFNEGGTAKPDDYIPFDPGDASVDVDDKDKTEPDKWTGNYKTGDVEEYSNGNKTTTMYKTYERPDGTTYERKDHVLLEHPDGSTEIIEQPFTQEGPDSHPVNN